MRTAMKNHRISTICRLALTSMLLIPASVSAQEALSAAASMISDTALAGAQGRVGLNMAAGDANVQANSAALAIGEFARATSSVDQTLDATKLRAPSTAVAVITDRAFSNAAGLISVNQASGTGNLQVNSLAIGLGSHAEAVSESRLSAITTRATPKGVDGNRTRSAVIADTAFEGARGLVQVNQAAGSGNSTANHFALIVQ